MKVIFTRHGETHQNVAGISMGQGMGGDLNEAGLIQAEKLALRLKDETIHYAYISDLKRTVDTASEVLKYHPEAEVVYAPELRERNLGIYGGGPRAHWKKAMEESPLPFHIFKPEGGESYGELQERVGNFYFQLIKKHANDTVLLLSHTGALTMLFLKIFNRPTTLEEYEKFKPDNTSVTICEVTTGGEHILRVFNSTEHLLEANMPDA